MSRLNEQEAYNVWNECVHNESLRDLIPDPRIRMVTCRDYLISKSSEIGENATLDDLQNYESDILANLNLK